ncbi:hypothetical protein V5R04_07010 [Jonesiaceae bacterium BS-20]|uniref:Thioredoxin domain-containing protein n=1 Tax=Jonesiaceae bacterium BS-20 TaxID=3120821 RepID=A0AAU7DY64_9MICO
MNTALLVSNIVVWLLLLFLALAVLALYRHFGQLYINSPQGRETQGPELGSHLLVTSDVDMHGQEVIVPIGSAMAIIFTDTMCTLCAEVRRELAQLAWSTNDYIVAFCTGRQQDVDAWAAGLPANVSVVYDHRARYANKYEVNGTPFAVIVSKDGTVHAKSIINGAEGVGWIQSEIAHANTEALASKQGGHEHP